MPTGEGILARARAHVGQKYEHGVVPKDDPNWKGPWDCAEFASWLVYQEGEVLYGCNNPEAGPAKADAYTGAWRDDARKRGKLISVEAAAATPGAMLLRYPPRGEPMGHIAVSDGKGGTVEAKGKKFGVVADKVARRHWDVGVLIPGFEYGKSSERVPVPGPEVLYAIGMPNMSAEVVKGIQRALRAKGFDPGEVTGDFGQGTLAAVRRFQEAMGIVVDGEVGKDTAGLLGVRLTGVAGAVAEVVVSSVIGTNPLLAVATLFVPAIARAIADDRGVAASVSRTVAEVTGATDPAAARARLDEDPELRATLQIRLEEIASARERERIAAEAAARQEATAAETQQRAEDFKTLKAKLDDVAGARENAVKLATIGGPTSWGPLLVSGIVTVGFFGILFLFIGIMLYADTSGVDETFLQIVNISIGALTVAFSTVVTFWLGSSEGSRRKDQTAAVSQAQQAERERERDAETKSFAESMVEKAVAPPAAPAGPSAPAAEAARGSNFGRCLNLVLGREGGFSNHREDNGGATNFGITAATLAGWRGTSVTEEDVRALGLDEAKEIYRSNYWNRLRCDDLPIGVDLLVFDLGVHAGPGTAAKLLQKAVGAEQDGSIGDATLGAAKAARPREIVEEFSKLKMARYQTLSDWATFANGWTARSDAMRTAALDMLAPAMLGPRPLAA